MTRFVALGEALLRYSLSQLELHGCTCMEVQDVQFTT